MYIYRRKIWTCILLTVFTAGIYGVYWKYLLVKNTKFMQQNESGYITEFLCLVLVPFYSLFWWVTRGKAMGSKFAHYGFSIVGNEIVYLLFCIFGLEIVSMAMLQSSFNALPIEFDRSGLKDAEAPLLVCENVSLGYEGSEIVHGLNFKVESGDYLCIIGENGSGKSTLMRTILGLQSPVCGKIIMGGGLKRNEIGYLPQQTVVQRDFPASVWEIVLSGCGNRMGLRPFYNQEEKNLAKNNIEKMGLTPLIKRCYRELSGGQQQRVLLARALCATQKMLLLDEPVSGLDPKVTAEMYELIERINKEDGITVIMISHDMNAAVKYADRILHIGQEIFFGTKEEYLESDSARDFLKGGENI